MNINYPVPHFANTSDNTHCLQAAYKMVLKYFLPEQDFSWVELDVATNKQKDKWTWDMAGLVWLVQKGFKVAFIEDFDYDRFLNEKEAYLIDRFGSEIAEEQIKNSDIDAEFQWVKPFLEKVDVQNRSAKLEEIIDYLKNGYLVIANVNSKSLRNKAGYAGHFVVVRGFDKEHLIINDPGDLPGIENEKISFEQFTKGWSYPDSSSNSITAIKL